MSELRNVRVLLEYDGAPYVGWQFQPDLPTVEGHVLAAVERVTGMRPPLTVAGRTDGGVHARAQVVSLRIPHRFEPFRLGPALNAHLPPTISVHRAEAAPEDFDARADSLGKRYRYRIYHGRQRAALETRAWYVPQRIDLDPLRRAAEHLLGELDFEAFRSTQCDAHHAVRRMFSIAVQERPRPPLGRTITITFHANAYCRHMCRIIAGTLVEVGIGQRTVASVREALLSRDRTRAGVTAPPHGLTLLEVLYPGGDAFWQEPTPSTAPGHSLPARSGSCG